MMRVAVVGGGLSGLAAAHELARSGGARVTVYEKEEHLGGGGNKTMAVDDGAGGRVPVDLGCMVFNRVRKHACALLYCYISLDNANNILICNYVRYSVDH
jgi:predicted NAD/FAD-binding protein